MARDKLSHRDNLHRWPCIKDKLWPFIRDKLSGLSLETSCIKDKLWPFIRDKIGGLLLEAR